MADDRGAPARGHLLRQRRSTIDWLIGWLAYCVQHPGRQAEVAVVLRGLKGTGKGMVGQMLMRIFRDHSLHITNSKHLVGNFNAHLVDALFLFLDEAFWAGDKQGEGTLKALITERTLMIEPKGVDSFQMPNRLKILMATNNDWVVPASADERRYFVLDVSDMPEGRPGLLHSAGRGDRGRRAGGIPRLPAQAGPRGLRPSQPAAHRGAEQAEADRRRQLRPVLERLPDSRLPAEHRRGRLARGCRLPGAPRRLCRACARSTVTAIR